MGILLLINAKKVFSQHVSPQTFFYLLTYLKISERLLKYYKLDPCHYFTRLAGLSWDAILKMTDIKLELMTNIDMFQFIEKRMRGGISYTANRLGKAINKYMKKYDEKVPSKYHVS